MYSTSSHRCFGTGNTCPSSTVTSCTHSEDVTVQCCKTKYIFINLNFFLKHIALQLPDLQTQKLLALVNNYTN